METDIERPAGTLFDESSHGGQVGGLRAEGAAPGIQALQFLIAGEQEMLQAKILLIQRCNRGAAARSFATDSFMMHCLHRPQAQYSNSAFVRVRFRIPHIKLDALGHASGFLFCREATFGGTFFSGIRFLQDGR